MRRSFLVPCLTLAALASTGSAGAEDPPLSSELARLWSVADSRSAPAREDVRDFLRHFGGEGRPLLARVRACDLLAREGSEESLRALLARGHLGPFPQEERAFAASSWAAVRGAAPGLLGALYEEARAQDDPWLELNLLRAVCAAEGAERLVTLIRDARERPLRRAGALEALGLGAPPGALEELLPALLGGERLPRLDEDEERLLLCAAGSALLAAEERAPCPQAARALGEHVLRHEVPPATREGVQAYLRARGRQLPRRRPLELEALRGVQLVASGAWQVEQLVPPQDGGPLVRQPAPQPAPVAPATRTRQQTAFMGSTTQARRVVFVIDMSDSMLLPLSPAQRAALGRLARDGTLGREATATRWGAARQLLIEALETLPERVHFAVVGFGDQAFTLPATPKLSLASGARVKHAIAQLRGIEPDPGKLPLTLAGKTNLHDALALAFQLTCGGRAEPGSEHLRLDGAQALFLFSDGQPNVYPDRTEGRGPDGLVPATPPREVHTRQVVKWGPPTRHVIPESERVIVVRHNPETGETVTRTERVPRQVVTAQGEPLEWAEVTRTVPGTPRRVEPFPVRGDPYQLWRQRERWRLNAFRHVAIHATVLADGPGHVSELLGLVRTGPGELRVLR